MKLGWHAPPSGSRSGVADYAEQLRPALAGHFEVVTDAAEADIHLYHLGNNRLHADIYERAMNRPGIIVLHDAVLNHFFLGTRNHDGYLAEWVANYGEWNRELGGELWRERAKSATDPRYFRYPMLRPVVARSLGVIVHNPGAAAVAREHGARNVSIIPHFVGPAPRPDAFDTAEFRKRIGLEPGVTLFGIFGYLREPKRIAACLKAFGRLNSVRPQTALLLAGQVTSPDLARFIDAECARPGILRLEHLTEAELRLAMGSVDCCLNLRYPAAGETSGIAMRAMAAGVPVVVTDSAENSNLPEAGVLRVAAGISEREELFVQMLLITDYPDVGRAVGAAGQRHVQTVHALDAVVGQYRNAIISG